MRHSLIAAAVVGLLAVPGIALAASTTVDGEGDIAKMRASNGDTAVKVSLKGLEELCGGTQHVNVAITWGTDASYEVDGACVSGEWGQVLSYLADADSPETGKVRPCSKLKVRHRDGAVRVRVPRSCINKAGDRIRVRAEGQNFGTLTGGTAGPTKRLRRG
jgi:hypothetical protein